ncbi:MAG: DUF1579 domain-containing protein [Phycisphaerales bacterium]|nr:DUF1579 domain-containing protein [Phycisphaerales bacterium]
MNPNPEKQHQWLQKFVGDWTYEHELCMEPGKPAIKCPGTESGRGIGALWIIVEGKGQMPDGGKMSMMLTLGYDPAKKRFVGSWVGSMMTYHWVYDGELDAAERILTLNASGPSCTEEGKVVRYRDVHEFISNDHRTLSSFAEGEGGKWDQIMKIDYSRKK